MPLNEFRAEAKRQLEALLVSTKSRNKVVTRNVNKIKGPDGIREKTQLTPRGQLHNETIYGSIKRYATKEEKVGANFDVEHIAMVANKKYREALMRRLTSYGNDTKKAFTGKNSLEKNPLYVDELHTMQVPSKVKLVFFETVYTIRKAVTPDLKTEKVIAKNIRKILQNRLDEFGGDAKKAFSNLDENPIWLNEEKGIAIKHVTISGISNAEAIHYKRDKTGEYILDEEGHKEPVDYVNTGNNHHAAIYCDGNGNLHEKVVSFYEATSRASQDLPIVDKDYMQSDGWHFLFSIKQNEYFVFPDEQTGFDPKEIDLKEPQNYAIISKNLYRVQKLTTKDYFFRHHLETTVENKDVLKDISWKRITSLDAFNRIVKVRINHIGEIVSVGEY